MTNPREIIRKARRDIHSKMGIPALYYSSMDDGNVGVGVPITARLTDHLPAVANPEQSRFGLADMETVSPKLTFMLPKGDAVNGISPLTSSTVALYGGDVYRLSAVQIPHDITVTVECIRMKDSDAAKYPAPTA